MLAPAALSLLTTTFTEPAERGKAFGIYAAIAGMGGAIGLLLGGALTETARLALVPVRVDRLRRAGGDRAARACCTTSPVRDRPRLDLPGTLTASSGLFALVFGLSRARDRRLGRSRHASASWSRSAVLLAAFVALAAARRAPAAAAARGRRPRPRRRRSSRSRPPSAGIFGVFLFLTFYLQNTKGLTALETGLAFLPMSFSIAPTVGDRRARGCCPAPARGRSSRPGMLDRRGRHGAADAHRRRHRLRLARPAVADPDRHRLRADPRRRRSRPPPPACRRSDSGVASAMVNTSQQIGGSIGTALLSTLAVSATTGVRDRPGAGARGAAPGRGPRLHHRVLVGGGDLRRRRAGVRGPAAIRRAPPAEPRRRAGSRACEP